MSLPASCKEQPLPLTTILISNCVKIAFLNLLAKYFRACMQTWAERNQKRAKLIHFSHVTVIERLSADTVSREVKNKTNKKHEL